MRPLCRAAVVALGVAACAAASDIGGIEFFGYGDLDRAAIRESLPLREGSPWLEENREALRNSVKDQVGTDPADMAVTCCDESGNRWIYIGLGREVGPGIGFLDAPHGAIRLSEELLLLYERLEKALIAAVERGGEAIREDVSRGYALTRDPAAQAIELQIRDYALTHDAKIFRALRDSSDARHRAIAAEAAGYAEHSAEQVAALCRAVRDSSADVRNNAIRALRVLASSDVELAAPIPASLFLDLLSSGVWADRNKSVAVLASR